jgi:hypothetical protein
MFELNTVAICDRCGVQEKHTVTTRLEVADMSMLENAEAHYAKLGWCRLAVVYGLATPPMTTKRTAMLCRKCAIEVMSGITFTPALPTSR